MGVRGFPTLASIFLVFRKVFELKLERDSASDCINRIFMFGGGVMRVEPGRPSKYGVYIHQLDDAELYSGASAVMALSGKGAFRDIPEDELKLFRFRMRVALNNKARSFPAEGDGEIKIYGQPTQKAYFGTRWKKAYPVSKFEAVDSIEPHSMLPIQGLERDV